MCRRARIALVAMILAASAFISGCGLLNKGKEKIDPPKEVSFLKEGEELEATPELEEEAAEGEEAEAAEEGNHDTVMRDLYLIDKNGYVVSQTLPLPKSESAAKQVLEYLVADGPVTEILPNGFRTVLPADTTVDVNIEDGKAVVDFSEEFANYEASDELKVLQAVTWTLTQFESVETVELRINGHKLEKMPVNGTPIHDEGMSRDDGINIDVSGVSDITNSRPVTVYFLAQVDEEHYYVPVTRRVSNKEKDDITAVVNELVAGPGTDQSLVSSFISDVRLVHPPKIDDGVVTLHFNEAVLGSDEENMISEETLQSLVLSLTEQEGIESVSVAVDGKKELVNEKGEPLTAPVSRPEKVNATGL